MNRQFFVGFLACLLFGFGPISSAEAVGEDHFPVTPGDSWTYSDAVTRTQHSVTNQRAYGTYWRYLSDFLGQPRWVAFAYSTLYVWDQGRAVPVLRFDRSSWRFSLSGSGEFRDVTARLYNGVVHYSAGQRLDNCVQFALSRTSDPGWKTDLVFAPHLGLVRRYDQRRWVRTLDMELVGAQVGGRRFPAPAVGPIAFDVTSHGSPAGWPLSLAVGDMTADGYPDVVFCDGGGGISIYPNNGQGGFGTQAYFTTYTGAGSRHVRVGDLNNDGNLDVLAIRRRMTRTGPWLGDLAVFLGNGTGTLRQRTDWTVPAAFAYGLGDADGDGNLDVLSSSLFSSEATALLGNGQGRFVSHSTVHHRDPAHGLALGDVNGDGNLDMVLQNQHTSAIAVLRGDGQGRFSILTDAPVSRLPYSVNLADLNEDQVLDLIVAHGDHTVSAHEGRGDGTFGATQTYATPRQPWNTAVADMNQDGSQDVVVFSRSGVSVFPGSPAAIALGARVDTLLPAGGSDGSVADLNGDGRPDVVVAHQGGFSVLLAR